MFEPGDPLVVQIRAQQAELAARAAERLRREVPWFQTVPPAMVLAMVQADCIALGTLLVNSDMETVRRQVSTVGEARLREGAPAADLITAVSLLAEEVQVLIPVAFPNPTAAGEATRRLQSLVKNIRLILSGVNLRLLMAGGTRPGDRDPLR